MNLHEFYIGKAFDAYEYFGAHLTKNGVLFRVYAPNAEKIEVIGEFNGWDGTEDEMIQDAQSGVFECVQKDAKPGMMYKYRIYQPDGIVMDRFDPYSFGSQVRPDTASVIVDLEDYHFSDEAWMKMNEQTKVACDIYGPLLLRNGNPVLRRFLVRQHRQLTQILQKLQAQTMSEKIERRIAEVSEELQYNESAYTILGAIKNAGI